jgi:hypothetical protein
MTVAIEATETRTQPAAKKVAKKTKTAAKAKKPEKVKGIGNVNGRFEVVMFLGSYDTIEEAIACREKGLAFRESLKAAPAPAPKKKKVKAN